MGFRRRLTSFWRWLFFKERELPVVVGRFFNVVGPRQTGAYGMVLPRFVQAALDNRPLVVHDDGKQARCFAHVDDVIEAIATPCGDTRSFLGEFSISEVIKISRY